MSSDPLEALPDQTRIALLSGDFAELENLARATEAALDNGTVKLETSDRIREMAELNATLIRAAMRGVSAAKGRLARHETYSTYDSQGLRGVLPPDEPGRARRL